MIFHRRLHTLGFFLLESWHFIAFYGDCDVDDDEDDDNADGADKMMMKMMM